tara:strand:+ start:202 stop:1911 length:1710 start_codon:yes stop_codon:yes gene_type:complete
MVQIGRYSGPGRGLSQAGANLFSGAETKGGALLQGLGNLIASGGGEAIDIIRDIYNTGNYAMGQINKAPTPSDIVVDTAKYLASPSASAIEKQKKQEQLKLMSPFGALQQYTPTPFDELRIEEDEGLIGSDIQTQLNKNLKNNKNDTTDKADETPAVSEQDKLDELFTSALQSAADAREGQPTKRKTLEDYKKEFSDATGIDASGKVDKSGALMALGLALMQNKAGKGFNVGNMLSAVGEAGEKALPVFEKAKQQAKLAAAKAGEYALGKVAEDEATAKLEKEEMMKREQYYVVPKGEKGGPMGAVDSILKGDGEFVRVNKFELAKLDENQEFNDKFEIVKASDYNSILEEAMKTPEAKANYNKSLADATMFEDLDTKFKYYVPSDPMGGYKPLLVRPGEAINQLTRLEQGLETGKSNFSEIAKLVSATETNIPTQIVQSVQQLSRNLGIPISSEVPPITQLRRLLKKMSALKAAEILGETGKTLSDNDRRRVDDIVGEINFEKADREELIATLDGLYKTVIGQREKDIAQFRANLGTFGNPELKSYFQQGQNQSGDLVKGEDDIYEIK